MARKGKLGPDELAIVARERGMSPPRSWDHIARLLGRRTPDVQAALAKASAGAA